jgi:hypothetical protein
MYTDVKVGLRDHRQWVNNNNNKTGVCLISLSLIVTINII